MTRHDHRYQDPSPPQTPLSGDRLQADLEEYRDMITEALFLRPPALGSEPANSNAPTDTLGEFDFAED